MKQKKLKPVVPEKLLSNEAKVTAVDFGPEVEDLREGTREAQMTAMSMGPVQTTDIKKKKKQLYPPELEPYKLQLEEWVENRRSLMGYFMGRDDQNFDIIYGDWFWYKPGRKNTICMGVLAFKQALDLFKDELAEGLLTLDQIMFALLHELAHMKTTREGDRAGLSFILDHFKKYLPSKKVESADQPGKYISLTGTYFQFYNILEDCIVNRMVLNTPWYSEAKLQNSIKGLYVGPFFELYQEAGSEGGTHAEVPNEKGKITIQKVQPGTGNLVALKTEDYQKGFDASALYERSSEEKKSNLSGNWLTYFIKSQMGVMPAKGFYDAKDFSKDDDSRYLVESEIAACFKEKVPKLFERLLSAVVKQYSGDQDKLNHYLQYMGQASKAKTYKVENGKVVEGEPVIYYNVIAPNAQKNVGQGDLFLALNMFKQGLAKLQIAGIEKMTLPELFEEFKRLKNERARGNTIPFVHTYAERTHIIRKVIEPIFSLLCILDDSFHLDLPEQTMEHGEGEENESDEDAEMDPNTVFTEGREVEVDNPGDPNHGRRGIITKVTRNGDDVVAVEIDYFEEVKETKMTTTVNGREVDLTGEKEEFTDFLKKLIVIAKKGKKGKGGQQNPQGIKTKTMEKDEDDEGNESADQTPSEDLPKEIRDFADQVSGALEEQEKDQNKKNLEEAMSSIDYQQKRDKQSEKKRLKDALKKEKKTQKKKSGLPVQKRPELNDAQVEASINEMHRLEDMLRPYMDAMARQWLGVVENIAAEIQSFKDRFYREGKINIKRLQKYFPEIEFGQDIDTRLVKEKIVERLIFDLKPKMLRLHVLIDNSGSMGGLLPSVKMALMLLYGSMSSLRNLFVRQMQESLDISASEAEEKFGLMTDVRISLFGSTSRTIKPFDFEDLSFLEPGRFSEKPPTTDLQTEQVELIRALSVINASEGTNDSQFWPAILGEYSRNPAVRNILKNNAMTDVLVQISDGEIPNSASDVKRIADQLKQDFGLRIGGFAIGDDYKSAMIALGKRHGLQNVISAKTPEEIVRNFALFLTNVVKDQIEKPYIDALKTTPEDQPEDQENS